MARPKKPVNLTDEQITNLAQIGCTDAEIAALVDLDEATVQRRFAPQLKAGRANLKARLRRAQLELALGVTVEEIDPATGGVNVYTKPPHPAMAIFLGKVMLRQAEAKEEPAPPITKIELTYVDRPSQPDDNED